jgi:hypothetical protein
MRFLRFSLSSVVGVAIGTSSLLFANTAFAAERVVFKYGAFRESIPVADLETLATTGESSPLLEGYMRLAKTEPEKVQKLLTREIKIDVRTLDRMLNTSLGELALDKIGEAIQTPAQTANREALRSALILSASEDGKISLIEALKNYPTTEVHVEGKKIAAVMRQFGRFARTAGEVSDLLKF